LVAPSYGGNVITEAGTDPSVGLVYVAAHVLDAGENEADDGKRFPSDLSKSGAIKKTADSSLPWKYFGASLEHPCRRSAVFTTFGNFNNPYYVLSLKKGV